MGTDFAVTENGEAMDKKRVKRDALDAMWSFLQMGGQEVDIPTMREYCERLRKMMLQKTAGQRKDKPKDVSFDDLDGICNGIVIEAMALYLSGTLDRLEEETT